MEEAAEKLGGERGYPDCVAGVVDGGHPDSPDRRERGVEGREVGVGVGDDRDPRRLSPLPDGTPSQIPASFTGSSDSSRYCYTRTGRGGRA
jgi:hypothetical protein